MPTPLAERLKTATKQLHRTAERSGVMAAMLRGELGRGAYVALLRNLAAIYDTLEPALAHHATHPALRPLHDPALARAGALHADLTRLHGPGWADEVPVEPAAAAYAARLADLAARKPALLVAHAYVRYLGDLSGGQMLGPMVERQFGLAPGEATAFYRFGPPAQPGELKQAFRAALDALPLQPGEDDAIVAEACDAFGRHVRLFVELQQRHAVGG